MPRERGQRFDALGFISIMTTKSDAVIARDLQFICDSLSAEFSSMAGKKLFISGGAGFLGYYLVQSVLEWNARGNRDKPINLTVADNFIRGIPDWLGNLANDSSFRLLRHDITQPLPSDAGPFDFFVHAASIASPTFYRQHPIETMDANVHGLRLLLDRALDQKRQGAPPQGFLFFSSSE